MDETVYREMVIKMRAHQDAWFRLHKQSDLIEARKLERLVDAENKRWLGLQSKQGTADEPMQRNLFKRIGDDNEATKDQ